MRPLRHFWILAGSRMRLQVQGTSIVAKDKSLETPLVDGKACAYATFDDRGHGRIAGSSKPTKAGAVDWKKPISCHLYPVRVKDYSVFTAVNYHRWQICSSGCSPMVRNQADAVVSLCGRGLDDEKFGRRLVCGIGACGKRTK